MHVQGILSASSWSGIAPHSSSVRDSPATNLVMSVTNPRIRDRSTVATSPASRSVPRCYSTPDAGKKPAKKNRVFILENGHKRMRSTDTPRSDPPTTQPVSPPCVDGPPVCKGEGGFAADRSPDGLVFGLSGAAEVTAGPGGNRRSRPHLILGVMSHRWWSQVSLDPSADRQLLFHASPLQTVFGFGLVGAGLQACPATLSVRRGPGRAAGLRPDEGAAVAPVRVRHPVARRPTGQSPGTVLAEFDHAATAMGGWLRYPD